MAAKLAHLFLWGTLVAVIAIVLCAPANASNCHHFFKQAVVAAPVYAAPVVYYQAGANIELESQIRKAVREELRAALIAPQAQQQTAPPQKPTAFAKCISCHSGQNAKGGVILDGTARVDCHTYARWGEIAGIGENVPPAMAALVKSMTPQEKGDVNTLMLRLGAADRAKEFVPPAPGELQ